MTREGVKHFTAALTHTAETSMSTNEDADEGVKHLTTAL